MLDTGFPRADVDNDFLRARRRQFLAALAHRLRGRTRLLVGRKRRSKSCREPAVPMIVSSGIVCSPSCR